jgi:hypothetical protein
MYFLLFFKKKLILFYTIIINIHLKYNKLTNISAIYIQYKKIRFMTEYKFLF